MMRMRALILDRVTPAAIEPTLAIEDEIVGRIEQAATQRVAQLTRARYDAELAQTRYDLMSYPANRLHR